MNIVRGLGPQGAAARVGQASALGGLPLVLIAASANGGYFPTTWGWIVLALAWAACLALVFRERIALTRLELATLSGLMLFTAWVGASVAWSSDRSQSVLELQRDLIYVLGVLAALLIVRRRSVALLLGGLLAAAGVIAAYALFTRLFPARGPGLDPIVLNQLSRPIGYPNGLGILCVIGALVALGIAARGQTTASRTATAALLPILLTALYFTYSRGAWIALGAGLVATLALDPRRLQLVTVGLVVAPWSVLAVWLASREHGLASLAGPYANIRAEGSRLSVLVAVFSVLSAVAALLFSLAERRIVVRPQIRLAYMATVGLVAVSTIVGVVAHYGGPAQLGRRAYDSFTTPPRVVTTAQTQNDLNARLLSLGSTYRIQQWKAAWHDYEAKPWLGSGAGTFEQYWLAHRTIALKVRDAHSLYLETIAELGWGGMLLLAVALGAPLVAAVAARRRRFGPAAFAAYVAYLVHAGVDWDWELPAITLAGLLCGVALLVNARADADTRRVNLRAPVRVGLGAALLFVAGFSVLGVVGNRALAAATTAVDNAQWQEGAKRANEAIRWLPWSGEGWQQLGDAELGLGDRHAAHASLVKASLMSPEDWSVWFDLGTASTGPARRLAYRRAAELNPLDPNVRNAQTSSPGG